MKTGKVHSPLPTYLLAALMVICKREMMAASWLTLAKGTLEWVWWLQWEGPIDMAAAKVNQKADIHSFTKCTLLVILIHVILFGYCFPRTTEFGKTNCALSGYYGVVCLIEEFYLK